MCSLRDAETKLTELGATIYGVSRDGVKDLASFAKEQELPFPLLSDPDGSLVDKYAVAYEGRPFAKRVTFVIDPKGVLRHIDDGVNVDSHGKDLIEIVERFKEGK